MSKILSIFPEEHGTDSDPESLVKMNDTALSIHFLHLFKMI